MTDRTEQLQARVRDACERGDRLTIVGSGSYSACGPVATSEPLSTREHTGIVSYEPTEMVVTVRSGTKISELESLLGSEGQQLGVELPGLSEDATIGGAIAMGLSGSSRPFTGAIRDFVLGVRMINGLGDDLRFGGQVMKNVAGYDLPRLLVGSRGSMGLLLEISLRVLPLAEAQLGLVFEKPGLPDAVAFTNQLTAAAEPLTGASYYRGRLHLRFSGRDGTLQRLRQELGGEQDSANWWTDLRQWRFPWGAARWRNYREQLAVEPRTDSDWLADWNGSLIWSVDRESTAASAVDLQQMSPATGVRGEIEQRLRAAFDPQGIFSGGVR
jgi:glycolate oxidase FAD binding subunit